MINHRVFAPRGVRGAVRCGFGPVLVSCFAVRFSQNHNRIASHFCDHICGVVWCGLV